MTDVQRRMRGDERRAQLLDAAATIVVEHGAGALTMERLAAATGVSKALPYKHFANSDEVLAELYRRETMALGRAVWRALRDAPPDADLVRVGVHTYFDEVVARGPVLAALSRPGSTIAAAAAAIEPVFPDPTPKDRLVAPDPTPSARRPDPGTVGVIFEVEVLHRFHGVPRTRAKQIAGIVQGAVVGAANTLHAGHSSRARLEDDLVAVTTTLIAPPPR
jgi:AcrR family transcriptional regulator